MNPSQAFRGKDKCNCKVQKAFCAVLGVFLLIFAIAINHNVHAQFGFKVRKPGAEKKDDDPEAPADKQIVDIGKPERSMLGHRRRSAIHG